MPAETSVQNFVYKLEEGGWARWIKFCTILALFGGLAVYLVAGKFRGLSSAAGMDQAQIARELARGHGFATKVIRPLAYHQFVRNKGGFPKGPIPDTFHAPLNPLMNSVFLRALGQSWDMTTKELVYPGDRMIAGAAAAFLLGAMFVNYLTLSRLFDQQLAALATCLALVGLKFWDYALSGLPQMLMLLLFSGCLYAMVRAVQAHFDYKSTIGWLALTGGLFGLLALTHALTIWIYAGAVIFSVALFEPRWRTAGILLAVFLAVYGPWLVRTYRVSGNPTGTALYTLLYQIDGEVSQIMRSQDADLMHASPRFLRNKAQNQLVAQLGECYGKLAKIVAAPVFFIALLHLFKRRDTSVFRWGVLLMWAMALSGMCLFGLGALTDEANDLWILFVPIMTAYGLAFLLVLWNRVNIPVPLARTVFLVVIFAISSIPLAVYLLANLMPIQWPPYVPPFIAILNNWVSDEEVIASDAPWAVAWYADRRSVWLPRTQAQFLDFVDYNRLHAPLAGIYLCPISGDGKFFADIAKGQWKEWAAFVIHSPPPARFPFKAAVPMPLDDQCIFYSDRARWMPGTSP